jgi:hypothetical protein
MRPIQNSSGYDYDPLISDVDLNHNGVNDFDEFPREKVYMSIFTYYMKLALNALEKV